MNKSSLFYTDQHRDIQAKIAAFLNAQTDLVSARSLSSTRAVGDAVQEALTEDFASLLGDVCKDYSDQFARRAMADLAFTDHDGFYYVVDVKTHRLDAKFSMPNLTSVRRLSRLYEDSTNYFVVLMVEYAVDQGNLRFQDVHFTPIEFLAWDCLTIGALGWGQIQIANANTININEGYSRRSWMIGLCDVMLDFYPREIGKIQERLTFFEELKEQWENEPED